MDISGSEQAIRRARSPFCALDASFLQDLYSLRVGVAAVILDLPALQPWCGSLSSLSAYPGLNDPKAWTEAAGHRCTEPLSERRRREPPPAQEIRPGLCGPQGWTEGSDSITGGQRDVIVLTPWLGTVSAPP